MRVGSVVRPAWMRKRDLQVEHGRYGGRATHPPTSKIRAVLVEVVWFSLGAKLEDGRRKLEELLTLLSHIGEARESRVHRAGACQELAFGISHPLRWLQRCSSVEILLSDVGET